MISKKDLEEKFINNDIIFIKNIFNNTPSWDRFINLIDYVSSDNYIPTGIRSNAFGLGESMYLRIADSLDPLTQKSMSNLIPELDPVVEYLNKEFGKDSIYGESYINLTINNVPMQEPHNDPWIAAAWGCIGVVEWRIYKDRQNINDYKSYILNPGDLIVVPMGILHSVIALEPRASLTFAYEGA